MKKTIPLQVFMAEAAEQKELPSMGKTRKTRDPSEIPQPDRNPEVKPGIFPENPVLPEEEPEIVPENEPEEPGEPAPAEIPKPVKEK